MEVNGQIVSGRSIIINGGSLSIDTNPTQTITSSGAVGYILDGGQVNMNGDNQNVDTILTVACAAITGDSQT